MIEPNGLTEADRRYYLEAMGIQPWYPRVRLPAAPDPIVFDLDDTEAPADALVDKASPQPQPEAPEPSAPQLKSVEAPDQSNPTEAAEPAAEEAPARRTQTSPVPRFALSISVVGDYLITDSLGRGMDQPSASGQQLLLNILSTLGVTQQDIRTHHVIQWPLFTNRRVDQGIEQARLYVDEKVDQFVRQFEPKVLLSFGAVMPRLQDWQQPTGEYFGLPWVGLPSIYRMLTEPKQKAVAWSRLRPLVEER